MVVKPVIPDVVRYIMVMPISEVKTKMQDKHCRIQLFVATLSMHSQSVRLVQPLSTLVKNTMKKFVLSQTIVVDFLLYKINLL